MNKNYKKNSANKLAAYSAMAGAFIAVGTDANAQVTYVDISDELVEIGELFEMDLDGDSQGDLLFQVVSTSGGSWSFNRVFGYISTSVYSMGDPSNNVIGYSGAFLPYGSALNSGDNIGAGEDFLSVYNVAFLGSIYGGITYGPWADQTDKYLGVKFIVGGNTHYGWVRMDATVGPVSLTIKDYAFDATPDMAIAAGDVGGGGLTCDTPSPSVLVVSSTGAKIAWEAVEGAGNYKIQYRVVGSGTWQKEHTSKLKQRLTGLACSTTYEYQVAAVCTDGVEVGVSEYSAIATFTTGACRLSGVDGSDDIAISISPNPAQSFINLYTDGFETETITIEVYNVLGERITGMEVQLEDIVQLDVSTLQSGVYTVIISDGSQSIADQFVKQ
ncbi:MAG: T9SS type A sorting domain-containing protein [Chitinophagales bacterium]